jgi:hypothetical protein
MNGFFHIVKSDVVYDTNIYFVDSIQHSFIAVQIFLVVLLNSFIARAVTAQSV